MGSRAPAGYWLEFECIGYGSTYPITVAQKQFCATRIAEMAKATGLPVNRTTVPRPQRPQPHPDDPHEPALQRLDHPGEARSPHEVSLRVRE